MRDCRAGGVQVIRLLRPTFRRCHKTHSERGNDMKRSLWLACITLLHGMVIAATASSDEQNTPSYELDIDALPLMAAVKSLSDETGIEILYFSEIAEGVTSSPVRGEFTPQEALETMLVRTDLEVVQLDPVDAVAIRPIDDRGGDSESKNLNPKPVLMTHYQSNGSQAGVSTEMSDALETAEPLQGKPASPLEEIIVTGTNIRGVENPTVPVLRFDREDIDLSGAATLDDFLRTIPQNFASETQLTAESGNPFDSGRNFTQSTSVDLRGLGAGSTLTLLNGRRMTAVGETSNVDINVLPLGIIERIDVLTDGATAVYGSDAVGGVINFVTRKDYEGLDVNARYGTVTEGSKEDFGVGGAGGVNWGSGGVFAGVDYQETKPLLIAERGFVDLTMVPQPESTFGSDTERFSVAGGAAQEFGPRARFGVDMLYTDSQSEAPDLGNSSAAFLSEQNALFINSRFKYSVGERITAEIFMDHGRNRVDRTVFDPATEAVLGGQQYDNDLLVYEGRLSGDVFDIPGGAISFSLGGLYREEEFEARSLTGASVFTSGKRDVAAGYAEILVPVVGDANKLSFVQRLELSVAGRYEDYSDFGDSFDPKLGFYWEVDDEFSFRASYAEAFRAPTLVSINQEQTISVGAIPAFFFTAIAPEPDVIIFDDPFPGYIALESFGGNPDLKPERAKTWSAGFAYESGFIDGLSLQGNYFNIDYTDRLETPGLGSLVQDPNFSTLVDTSPDLAEVQAIFDRGASGEIAFLNFFNLPPDQVQLIFPPAFINIAEREVSGFDLNINYTTETAIGSFSAGVNASYLIDYIGRVIEGAPASEQINVLYRPIDLKLRGNISWSKNGFTMFTAVNYVDGYRDHIDSSIANGIDAWTTVDLSFSYHTGERFESILVDGTRFGFSVTNLFDNDPPFVATRFGLNYDSANADPFGRQISFVIAKSF